MEIKNLVWVHSRQKFLTLAEFLHRNTLSCRSRSQRAQINFCPLNQTNQFLWANRVREIGNILHKINNAFRINTVAWHRCRDADYISWLMLKHRFSDSQHGYFMNIDHPSCYYFNSKLIQTLSSNVYFSKLVSLKQCWFFFFFSFKCTP